jgi:hypothetical protein
MIASLYRVLQHESDYVCFSFGRELQTGELDRSGLPSAHNATGIRLRS